MFGIPEGVKLGISFDQSLYIRQSIRNLVEQALHGSLLAAAVVLIFLRNLTSTMIISMAIPSMLVTFIVLYFTNQTLNVFTLEGLRWELAGLWMIQSWNWRTFSATSTPIPTDGAAFSRPPVKWQCRFLPRP